MSLKDRFLEAVIAGKLGKVTEFGTIVMVPEFKACFNDISDCYASSFLPAAAIEKGRHRLTQTQYVFRVSSGVYRVHPDALKIAEAESKDEVIEQRSLAPVFRTINP